MSSIGDSASRPPSPSAVSALLCITRDIPLDIGSPHCITLRRRDRTSLAVLHHCRMKRLYHYYVAYQQQSTSAGIPKAACLVPPVLAQAFSPTPTPRISLRAGPSPLAAFTLVEATPRSCPSGSLLQDFIRILLRWHFWFIVLPSCLFSF